MRRREIFIELTSLLDVIMIMLFVLLTQARTQTADAIAEAGARQTENTALRQEVETLRGELVGAQDAAESARRQLLSQDLVLDNSLVVTVTAADRSAIRLEVEGGTQTVSYDWENENYARNVLRAALRQQLTDTDRPAVFLVFQYDRDAIYRAQYEMIRDVLQELKLEAARQGSTLNILELDTKS
ncbi:MAG: hypothetical protein IKQ10_07290 [Oscillospiraceae bacterium]|nr:hypothetical protein [Oscillospiraceae bacterium]